MAENSCNSSTAYTSDWNQERIEKEIDNLNMHLKKQGSMDSIQRMKQREKKGKKEKA
jgi:hypothetical protein